MAILNTKMSYVSSGHATPGSASQVAENEKLLALLCLSEDQNLAAGGGATVRWTPHMQLAHRLLLAYDSRIRGLDSHVRELTEHLDSTREIWHMQLDAMRNRIIHLGLHLEFAGISTMLATLPAGARAPLLRTLFCIVCSVLRCGVCCAAGLSLAAGSYSGKCGGVLVGVCTLGSVIGGVLSGCGWDAALRECGPAVPRRVLWCRCHRFARAESQQREAQQLFRLMCSCGRLSGIARQARRAARAEVTLLAGCLAGCLPPVSCTGIAACMAGVMSNVTASHRVVLLKRQHHCCVSRPHLNPKQVKTVSLFSSSVSPAMFHAGRIAALGTVGFSHARAA